MRKHRQLSQEDFPVSLFPQQENEKEETTSVISGQRCLELYEKLNRPMYLAKTLLVSYRWKMAKHLKGYSLIWKAKGTPSNRLLFQLAVLERGTGGIEFGLLPTPTTVYTREDWDLKDIKKRQKEVKNKTNSRKDGMRSGNGFGMNLAQAARLLPTPTKRDYRSQHALNSVAFEERKKHARGVNLVEQLQRDGHIGKLNPQWVEWLMGYPIEWTGLKD